MNNFLRQQYLQAMGIQNWLLRTSPDIVAEEVTADVEILPSPTAQKFNSQDIVTPEIETQGDIALETASQSISQSITHKAQKKSAEPVIEETARIEIAPVSEQEILPVSELEQAIKQCTKCPGRKTRLNVLAGQGNPGASVFVISEAPNAEEDCSGHYLSEQGQSLLTAMLQSIQLQQDYFFTGIIKCYSLSNYLFSEEEIIHCAGFLQSQIEQVNPSVILVLGAVPSQVMLQSKKSFNELRGKVYSIKINDKDYPLVSSYHPAYLLRNPLYKREALKDLILLKSQLQ